MLTKDDTMTSAKCPACASELTQKVYPDFSGTCITSDMEILPNARIDNRICETCGLVFNAAGTRGATREFYRDSYSLMTKNNEAAIQSFSGPKPISQADRTFELLKKFWKLPASGVILEAGAGKGAFLSLFADEFPNWEMHAFEPSQSFDYLARALPQASTKRCDYFDFVLGGEGADLVVALGVLEHVENPLDMLVWANGQLKEGGLFYIRVPNFAKNPNDLFCADHLSKITVPTLRVLAEATGFSVEVIEEAGVPVFTLLIKRSAPSGKLNNAYKENLPIVDSNVAVAKGIVDSILACRNAARSKGEQFAIFGLASAGLFAPFVGKFDADEIAAYIDENKTIWGNKVHGRPVGGIDLVASCNIRHVALSISPIYFEQVKAKLAPLGVAIYTA